MARPAFTHSRIACEELIIDVPQVMEPLEWPECCIHRVPKLLRKVNRDAYTPKLISIGPLHHGKKDLKDMEMLKLRYFKDFCFRTGKCQKELASIIEDNEINIRHCYAEASRLSSKEFVRMILLDGIFIIELFLRKSEKSESDYILSKPLLTNHIMEDLILLENQLPFFILRELHERFSPPIQGKTTPFLELACECLPKVPKTPSRDSTVKEVKHFTDLLRTFYCPSKPDVGENKPGPPSLLCCATKLDGETEAGTTSLLYSATKLDQAGVEFKGVSKRPLLDIQFEKLPWLKYFPCYNFSWLLACLPCLKRLKCLVKVQPTLEVPQFVVDDGAECLYRNLVALEQCHYPSEAYICDYIMLWDALINTEKDVDLLVEKKVIVNKLGHNEAVADLVNKLCEQTVENDHSFFHALAQKLHAHYDNSWNRHMASLTSAYFPDIWKGTATIVGLIILGFTLWGFISPPSKK